MKSLQDYTSKLQESINQVEVKNNFVDLMNMIIYKQTSCLYVLSEDDKQHVRFKRVLNGELKNGINSKSLNDRLLDHATDFLKDKEVIIISHDPSSIRKPESKDLDSLGHVRGLKGEMIGFETYNSIALSPKGETFRLLYSEANGDKHYVTQQERQAYLANTLDKSRRLEIDQFDTEGTSYNLKSVTQDVIRNIDKHIRTINPSAMIIDIFDRGFDDVALFEFERTLGHHFIIRCKLNRKSNNMIINVKGEAERIKLKDILYWHSDERCYAKIQFKQNLYFQARGIIEWGQLELNGQVYSVVKVRFYDKKRQPIFEEPMLLISDLEIIDPKLGWFIFEQYMHRSKIESVFKFCKGVLGWEESRVKDWVTRQNLLTLIFFTASYLYHIKSDLTDDYRSRWLCDLGNGKGQVSPYYLLKGLNTLMSYCKIKTMLEENGVTEEQLNEVFKLFKILKDRLKP